VIAASDPLIVEYAAKLLMLGISHSRVSKRTRLLARFLAEVRTLTGLCDVTVAECVSPENFHRCDLALRSLFGFDAESGFFATPSSAKTLKLALRHVNKLVKRRAVEQRNTDGVNNSDRFAELCTLKWETPERESPDDETRADVEPNSD